jgi:hypothetical protein
MIFFDSAMKVLFASFLTVLVLAVLSECLYSKDAEALRNKTFTEIIIYMHKILPTRLHKL